MVNRFSLFTLSHSLAQYALTSVNPQTQNRKIYDLAKE